MFIRRFTTLYPSVPISDFVVLDSSSDRRPIAELQFRSETHRGTPVSDCGLRSRRPIAEWRVPIGDPSRNSSLRLRTPIAETHRGMASSDRRPIAELQSPIADSDRGDPSRIADSDRGLRSRRPIADCGLRSRRPIAELQFRTPIGDPLRRPIAELQSTYPPNPAASISTICFFAGPIPNLWFASIASANLISRWTVWRNSSNQRWIEPSAQCPS
ncbi:hypothetical protein ZOSMA_159G00260 [Zostera marina]|uniref:Uncharacterized protein n=1 Tax=Zostera marina TaxID=29655 RepID=A0A0K9PV35_ZOSMR|nr:hypothetical protein ZOSMA_159G00260 [Zostera marina]